MQFGFVHREFPAKQSSRCSALDIYLKFIFTIVPPYPGTADGNELLN